MRRQGGTMRRGNSSAIAEEQRAPLPDAAVAEQRFHFLTSPKHPRAGPWSEPPAAVTDTAPDNRHAPTTRIPETRVGGTAPAPAVPPTARCAT